MTNLEKIVNEQIRKDCREEALKILSLSSEDEVNQFIKYHNENNGNICCLHLDYLKAKLVKDNKMPSGGHFGMPFTE